MTSYFYSMCPIGQKAPGGEKSVIDCFVHCFVYYFAAERDMNYCVSICLSVCLSVSLSAHVSQKRHGQTSSVFCHSIGTTVNHRVLLVAMDLIGLLHATDIISVLTCLLSRWYHNSHVLIRQWCFAYCVPPPVHDRLIQSRHPCLGQDPDITTQQEC